MSKTNLNLLVVAHPDDETIYFSGLLQSLRSHPWKVICVTDGNADGMGLKRREQFREAMRRHRVAHSEMWDFPDIYEKRLDLSLLRSRLESYRPAQIYTHGVLGEYGHPHHQDVCIATHRAFSQKKVWSVAYNCMPEQKVQLTPAQFRMKANTLAEVYGSETRRFVPFLPATAFEGFTRMKLSEVESVYGWLSEKKPFNKAVLQKLAWYRPYLEMTESLKRPF